MVAHGELVRFLERLDQRRTRLAALAESGSAGLSEEVRTVDEELLTAREELRVQAEELLAAQAIAALTSANYDHIVADSGMPHLQTDLDGLIIEANAPAHQLMTLPLLNWSRRPLVAHFTLPSRRAVRTLINLAARRSGHVTGEAVIRRGIETELPVLLAVVASPYTATLRWAVIPPGSS